MRDRHDTPKERRLKVATVFVGGLIAVMAISYGFLVLLLGMPKFQFVLMLFYCLFSVLETLFLWKTRRFAGPVAHSIILTMLFILVCAVWLGGGNDNVGRASDAMWTAPFVAQALLRHPRVTIRYSILVSMLYTMNYLVIDTRFLLPDDSPMYDLWEVMGTADLVPRTILYIIGFIFPPAVMVGLFLFEQRSSRLMADIVSTAMEKVAEAEQIAADERTANAAKTRFLAVMSHELRNPLTGVVLNAEMLRETNLETTQSSFVTGIWESAQSVLAIVNDILDVSKIEAGHVSLESLELDLLEVVESATIAQATVAGRKGIDLVLRVEEIESWPVLIAGDATRLRQVVTNLVSNAVKFTREGRVTVTLRYLEGSGDLGDPKRSHHFQGSVVDTGIGIDAEGQSRLFKEFSQVDQSTTRRFGGTGLGLFIVKQLLDFMGGSISVTSEAGKGTTFTFDFYVGAAPEGPSMAKAKRARAALQLKAIRHPVRVISLVPDAEVAGALSDCFRFVLANNLPKNSDIEATENYEHADAFVAAVRAASRAAKHPPNGTPAVATLAVVDVRLASPEVAKLFGSAKSPPLPMVFGVGICSDVNAKAMLDEQHFLHTISPPFAPSLLAARTKEVLRAIHHHHDGESFQTLRRRGQGQPRVEKRPGLSAQDLSAAEDSIVPIVLVTDDFEMMRNITETALQSLGFRTISAVNGAESVARVKEAHAKGDPVWVILMDCEMPVMDGFTATQHIRDWEASLPADERGPTVGIVAVTANAMREDRVKCIEAGMDAFAAKPVSRTTLQQHVSDLVRRRRRQLAGRDATSSEEGSSTSGPSSQGKLATVSRSPRAWQPSADAQVPEVVEEEDDSGKLHVLVADDADAVRSVVTLVLHSLGARVTEANGGEAALHLLEEDRDGTEFDAALVDLNMPAGMGGADLTKELRTIEAKNPNRRRTKVYALTGDTDVEKEVAAVGMDGVLTKPVTRKMLEKFMAQLRKEATSGAEQGSSDEKSADAHALGGKSHSKKKEKEHHHGSNHQHHSHHKGNGSRRKKRGVALVDH
jgi:signal transduction histidine kinase/DNA-binding response OmpR family regulator